MSARPPGMEPRMERRSIEAIIRALNDQQVRYLVVGGLAVVVHGHVRFTADLDLIVDLDPANVRRAISALSALGYRPRAPVDFAQFSDPAERARWIREKQLTVFSLFSPEHAATEIDVFVEMPLDFTAAHAAAMRTEVAPGVAATFVGLDDLIALKRRAGRPHDLDDIDRLRRLHRDD
jgi:hypothetical protein